MPEPKKSADWPEIEKDYRQSKESVRQIAEWHGVSHTAINKKAKAEGWVRENAPKTMPRTLAAPTDSRPLVGEVVDVAPAEIVERGQGLVMRMLDELDAVTSLRGEIEDMIQTHEEDPRRQAAMMRAVSLPERANTARALASALKTFSEVTAVSGKKAERQASADRAAASGGKFAPPAPPKLIVSNR